MKRSMLKSTSVLSVMTTTCIGIGLTGCGNNVEKISNYIDNASYEEALNIFNNWEMSEKDRTELVDAMRTKMKCIATDFAAENIGYDQAIEIYNTIQQMYLDELAEDEVTVYAEIQMVYSSKQMFTVGMEAMETGNYLYAIECFNQVLELDINYETALVNADSALQLYVDNVIMTARELAKQNDYEGAYDSLTEANEILSDNVDINNELLALHKQQTLEEAKLYAKEADYEKALTILNEYKIKHDANDSEVNNIYEDYSDNYVTFIMNKADNLRYEEKYLQALQMLENASIVVQSTEFSDMIAQINEEKPIYLCEVKCQNQERYEIFSTGEELMDTIGNRYAVGNLFAISTSQSGWTGADKGYAEYYLGYKYNSLSGIIAVEETSDNINCSITIEGDGVVLYALDLNRLTVPTSFNIDVSTVNILTIRSGDISDEGTFYTIISDFTFDK